MDQTERFDSWAIVDIFGHQKFAGRVTEQAIGGASFVRIDVPECDNAPAYTKLFGAAAIYCITPSTEELARKAVKYCRSEPISVYIPPDQKQLPGRPCQHGLFSCEQCSNDEADRQQERDDQERLEDEPF
jgi:hypothetical protein